MIVYKEHRSVFVGTPKCGSRAVWSAIDAHWGPGVERFGLHDVPGDSFEKYPVDDWRWLVACRHPYTRVISWYLHKRHWSQQVFDDTPKHRPEVRNLDWQRNQLGPYPLIWCSRPFAECFDDPTWLLRTYMSRDLGGATYQYYRHVFPNAKFFDHVIWLRQEQLEADLRAAGDDLAEICVPVVGDRDWPKESWRDYYTPNALRTVNEISEKDFEILPSCYRLDFERPYA